MVTRNASAVVLVALLALAGATVGVGTGATALQEENRTQTAEPTDRSITVTGRATAEAPPDEAVVTVAAVAEGDDPAAVREDLSANADALRGSLRDAGVADERVETVEFRIDASRSPYEPRHPPEQEGPDYRGVHAFRVTLEDVDRAGAVVDAAAGAGAEVRYVAFGLSEERRADLRDRALTDAMDDARRQADTLAAAGGLEATDVRSVDASDTRFGPVYADERSAEGGETVFSPGDVTVDVDLRVTYDAEATGAGDGA